ncbi:40s ribosomal protein s5-1 [Hordeum vulgare]|nr:40s ribosomal protein s5-1 [Hordeum vulgare]
MREGMLHIRDVEGAKKTGSMETRLEAMEQQVFKCQGMVERGLNANHMMITEFTNKHTIDTNDIGKHLSRLYDRIDQLQAQIYDLQNQNFRRPDKPLCSLENLTNHEVKQLQKKKHSAPRFPEGVLADVFATSSDSDFELPTRAKPSWVSKLSDKL